MTTWEPNIAGIFDIPADVYHSAPGVSNSMLGNMSPPARLPVYLSEARKVTPWMMMGTLIHQRVLEPDKPLPQIALVPETYQSEDGPKKWTFAAKVCQAWRRQQEAEGRLVVTASEMEAINGCVDAIAKDEDCATIFAAGQAEVSVFTGRQLITADGLGEFDVFTKARLDWVPSRSNVIADVKKVGEGMAETSAFMRLAVDRRYHVQAAYYLDNWNQVMGDTDRRECFVFVAVEDVAPFLVNRIEMGPDTIAAGRAIYMRDLETFARCKALRKWPGYPPGIHRAEAADWQLRRAA